MSPLIEEAPEVSLLFGKAPEMCLLVGEALEMSPLIVEAPVMVLVANPFLFLIWRVSSCRFSVVDAQPCDYDH